MAKKLIHIDVTSMNGHDEFNLLPPDALVKLKEITANNDKWVFVGSERKNVEMLTEQDLIDATTEDLGITVVSAIAGGCEAPAKPIEINVSYKNKQKHALVVDFVEDSYHREVNLSIAKEQVYDVLRNRDVIVRAIKKKLSDKVEVTIDDMAKVLNA